MRNAFVVALLFVSVPGIAYAQQTDQTSRVPTGADAASTVEFEENAEELNPDEVEDTNVIFSGDPEYGIYLAPTTQISEFQGQSRVFFGGRGGLVVSDVLRVGGGANWLLGGPNVHVRGAPRLRMRYGGGLIGVNIGSETLVHPSIDVLIGGGKAHYEGGGVAMNGRSASFFVVDASTGLDFNLAEGVRFHIGGGYRYLSQLQLPGIYPRDVSGAVGMAQLKFGAF